MEILSLTFPLSLHCLSLLLILFLNIPIKDAFYILILKQLYIPLVGSCKKLDITTDSQLFFVIY